VACKKGETYLLCNVTKTLINHVPNNKATLKLAIIVSREVACIAARNTEMDKFSTNYLYLPQCLCILQTEWMHSTQSVSIHPMSVQNDAEYLAQIIVYYRVLFYMVTAHIFVIVSNSC
jgi:hypothetical protein